MLIAYTFIKCYHYADRIEYPPHAGTLFLFYRGDEYHMGHYILQPGDEAEKPTPEAAARDALTTLRGLAEDAADRMKEILDNAEIPDGMKIAVINMVLERVYGRPEEMLRIESGERNVAAAEARLRKYGV